MQGVGQACRKAREGQRKVDAETLTHYRQAPRVRGSCTDVFGRGCVDADTRWGADIPPRQSTSPALVGTAPEEVLT